MKIHTHFTSARSILREGRMCAFAARTPEQAHDVLSAGNQMQKNPNVLAAMQVLDNPQMRKEYKELEGKHPLDRTFFQALVLNDVFRGRNDYAKLEKADIRIFDPFGLSSMASDEERGEWLLKNINPQFLKEIDSSDDPQRLGQIYMDHIATAEGEWTRTGKISDTLVQRLPMERYGKMRGEIDTLLLRYGIRVPQTENEMRTLGNENLNRREYFLLLAMAWRNDLDMTELEKRASGPDKLASVRAYIQGAAGAGQDQERLYVDLALQELGPNEALSGLGVVITPELISAYANAMKGPLSDPAEFQNIPALSADEGAATWELHPEYAYVFLNEHMAAAGTENEKFLDSLYYHFMATDEDRRGYTPPLDEKNTRALLRIVSQSLLEVEKVFANTNQETAKLKTALSTAEKIEGKGAEVWQYMKDIRQHPIGSAAMWLVAIYAARQTWKFATGQHKNFTNLVFGGAILGLGVGLFQQHQNGEAWWEKLGDKAGKFLGREKTKDPEKQTLPNYWASELELSGVQNEVILSVLSQQKLGAVIPWFKEMHEWKKNGSPAGGRPDMPIRVESKLKKYFGQSNAAERQELIYAVFEKFLDNRGRMLRTELNEYGDDMAILDNTQLGLSYINDRYLEQKYFQAVLRGIVKIGSVRIDGRKIIEWDPADPELVKVREENPDIYADLVKLHIGYEKEIRTHATADWDMSMVFLLEANPEILRRRGREGTEAAGIISGIVDGASTLASEVTAEPPEDLAKSETLFAGAESDLFTRFRTSKIVDAERVLTAPEQLEVRAALAKDWSEFVGRLPADAKARVKLEEYMTRLLAARAATPLASVMNEVEEKKYQLLIAATKSDKRLSEAQLSALDPTDDATWNTVLDEICEWVWFEQSTYPKMNSMYDLRSLFDSEVTQPGGVQSWEVWKRMFPRWEQSQFHVLDAQVRGYQEAIARLRALPMLEPGKILTQEEISDIERQLARRMANRTMEAMLITHGNAAHTPDAPGKRGVTPTEQENLSKYYNDLFVSVMDKSANEINPHVKLPGVIESLNNYIWNDLPNDVSRLTEVTVNSIKYVWDPVKQYWTETGLPWMGDKLNDANNYLWNELPGDAQAILEKTSDGFHYYVWDPTTKYWKEVAAPLVDALGEMKDYMLDEFPGDVKVVATKTAEGLKYFFWDQPEQYWREIGIPWTMEKLNQAGIKIAAGIDIADKGIRKLASDIAPVLKEFPGEFVEVTTRSGKNVIQWFGTNLTKIGEIAYDVGVDVKKKVYELHGVPEDKYDEFRTHEDLIEGYKHNGKNAGLSVTFLGTDKVKIGQFDAHAFSLSVPILTLTVDEFLDPTRELIKEWREKAFAEKKSELQTSVPSIEMKLDTDEQYVQYDIARRVGAFRAKSSIYKFVSTSDKEIERVFNEWLADPARLPTDIDPLDRL